MNHLATLLVMLSLFTFKTSSAQIDSTLTTQCNGSWKVVKEWKKGGDTSSVRNGDLFIIKMGDQKMTYIISPNKGRLIKGEVPVSTLLGGLKAMFVLKNRDFEVKQLSTSVIKVGNDEKCFILKPTQ